MFRRAEYRSLQENFLAIPSCAIVKEMEKAGWQFSAKKTIGSVAYSPLVTDVLTITSPEGQVLIIGKNPALWQRYKADREKALAVIYAPASSSSSFSSPAP